MNNSSSSSAGSLADLYRRVREVVAEQTRYLYVCHKDTLKDILFNMGLEHGRQMERYEQSPFLRPLLCRPVFEYEESNDDILSLKVDGVHFKVFRECPRWNKKWEPPASGSRFWEFTASDEAWARPLGIGRMVDDTTSPYILKIDTRFFDYAKEVEMFRDEPGRVGNLDMMRECMIRRPFVPSEWSKHPFFYTQS